jgi:hypothetical protein
MQSWLYRNRISQESTMTSFAHADYPQQHAGVIRAEQAVETFKQVAADLQNPKGPLASLIAPLRIVAAAAWEQAKRTAVAWHLARQDARMWELARHDHRLMAEIRRAQG